MKAPRLGRGANQTPEVALARGFTHALIAPKGHVVSYHMSAGLARSYLRSYVANMGCRVVALAALLAATPGSAHDQWADGSAIPSWVKASCCGPADAHHLTPDQVHRVNDEYYEVDGYGKQIPVAQALPSQDGDYWIFYRDVGGGIQSPVYCFFVPMNF